MDLLTRHEGDTVLVSPTGRLDLSTYAELRDGLLKQVAEQPAVLVVELTERFEIGSDTLAAVFATVRVRIAPWSGVRLVLVPTTTEHRKLLERTGVGRFVHTYATVRDARSHTPARRREEIQLPRGDGVADAARRFVLRVCDRWHAGPATVSAVLMAGEMVENTLRHTTGAPTVRVEHFHTNLVVTVRDNEPWHDGPHGRGIASFERLATAWGKTTTLDGGKIVWVSVSL
ncbi:hypothetical protein Lesp02_10010 [Lentzea sp. NBRC 105346]|uniref:STAS domain-containing protein n=1 Tax=Lentzea sp. NBRC 105346 TaxID=3032205 RepID=UPI0024A1D2FA|nr:STAS domain-containing protein [Lentzea sp. NBRC 105346]GLZ28811.1 hypothetical protein Lesp02_10010 [Lentzea sp. NBRC 105346]